MMIYFSYPETKKGTSRAVYRLWQKLKSNNYFVKSLATLTNNYQMVTGLLKIVR
jgi:hypothetical protein